MITDACQRWLDGLASYRPAGEPINPREFEVEQLVGAGADGIASRFVEAHHYTASYPAARFRFALRRGVELAGVAVFSEPPQPKSLADFPEPGAAVELGRLVLLDEVPANGESWFVARCFELLKRSGIEGVLSMSDPVATTNARGEATFGGHIGTIYQALNARFVGRATPRTRRLLPDGRVFSGKAWQKLRTCKPGGSCSRGWKYAAELLIDAGAAVPDFRQVESLAAWAKFWVPLVTRPLRHPGNYRYLWGFTRAVARHIGPGLAYPKNLHWHLHGKAF